MQPTLNRTIGIFLLSGLIACCTFAPDAGAADATSDWNLWNPLEMESGRAELRMDATASTDASAAMLVDTGAERAKGSCSRAIIVPSGKELTLSARMKAERGIESASLAVNLIGVEDGMRTVLTLDQRGDWITGSQSVVVPPETGMVFLHLHFEGRGKLWIDDLKIDGVLDTATTGKLNTFIMPFGYAFGAYQGHATVADGVAHIDSQNNQGGAGFVANADLTRFANQCPVLSVKLGPKNKAGKIRLSMEDVDGNSRAFEFDLTTASSAEFTDLLPLDGWAVSPKAADEPDQSFDPSRVKGHLLIGDWSGNTLDVLIREISFAEPTADLLELRREKVKQVTQQLARERERLQREAEARERLLTEGADHPEDGPEIQHVAAVAPDVLALTIQERQWTRGKQAPYEPQADDEIRTDKGEPRLAWDQGLPSLVSSRSVWRKPAGSNNLQRLGTLVQAGTVLTIDSEISGTPITVETLEEPRAYRIRVAASGGSQVTWQPIAVYRKSKPLERASNGQMPVRHVVYLKLPEPLQEGTDYVVELAGINTRQATWDYRHEPRKIRSEAVHVSQIGYRPSDPLKRAYLSVWLGTGGKLAFDVERFELLEAQSGRSVHTGPVELSVPAEQAEMLRPEKNHNGTNVYQLDFSAFVTPGEYRIFVPGIGVSYPFRIADDVWQEAFRTSMHGLLSHRSGIALGPPVTEYHRPRPFHPEDGMKIFRLDVTMLDGESDAVEKSLRRLLGPAMDPSKLEVHPDAWGGYMDAGDWDRRSLHIRVSYLQLELFEMFPEFFAAAKLALPASEAGNGLPDIVDEALWNLDFYRRLQDGDGGIGGGIESTAHPTSGEASWQESLLVGAFAPDPVSSYRYAAAAAKVAGILARYDAGLAETYRTSALGAWQWAEANSEKVIQAVRSRGGRVKETTAENVGEPRALAAVELYRLTRDEAYHAVFRQCTALCDGSDPGSQLDATFAYINLPAGLGDEGLQQQALDWFVGQGEQAITMSERNAFNIACRVPQLPMMGFVGYFTTPETAIGPVLPRLHYLTGDAKYLRGALAATQYTAGANPVNATMTTGLGHDFPHAPLHVDSRTVGCDAPRGITIYGPHDPAKAPGWVKTWILGSNLTPPVDQWPASEFHIDVSGWPEMSEYTVHQSIGPTGYYWGYLAARR